MTSYFSIGGNNADKQVITSPRRFGNQYGNRCISENNFLWMPFHLRCRPRVLDIGAIFVSCEIQLLPLTFCRIYTRPLQTETNIELIWPAVNFANYFKATQQSAFCNERFNTFFDTKPFVNFKWKIWRSWKPGNSPNVLIWQSLNHFHIARSMYTKDCTGWQSISWQP